MAADDQKKRGCISKLKSKCIRSFKHYVLFDRTVFFISGLMYGHSLVKYAVLATLIVYITEERNNKNLRLAAIILNAQEGLSSILVIFEAHLADSYFGRFKLVIFSTLSMIGGLLLLRLLDPSQNLKIFGGVVILIALGEAGKEPVLKAFLADQLKDTTTVDIESKDCENSRLDKAAQSEKEKELEDRVKLWWRLFKLLGAVSGAYGVVKIVWNDDPWEDRFLITSIVMGVSLLIFLSGFPFYRHEKPERSPISVMFKVLRNAFRNRGIEYSDKPSDYFEYKGHKLPISPDVPLSRWVDKAALKKTSENEVCRAEEVKQVKELMRMVPMWATFIVYCVTLATGSTFFYEQSTDLYDIVGGRRETDPQTGKFETEGGYKVPLVSFYLMQTFSSLSINLAANKVISSKWFKSKNDEDKDEIIEKRKLIAYKVRIGLGMACSCLACVAAMVVERERLHRYREYIAKPNSSDNTVKEAINMSVFYLTPQFCLLGLMEGLTEDGLVDFFYYQVTESAKNYGPSFNAFAMGLGKFFSIFWILAFKEWIENTINTSDLNKYYMVLALLNFGNLSVVYMFVSIFVYKYVGGLKQSAVDIGEERVEGAMNAGGNIVGDDTNDTAGIKPCSEHDLGGDPKKGGNENPSCFSCCDI